MIATIFTLLLAFAAAGTLGMIAAGPRTLRAELRSAAVPLASVVAATAAAGSLYFSEVEGFVPCELCWYQRIAMYPLVLTLGIATLRRDLTIARYAVPQAAIGAAISIYHYQLQLFPDQGSSCAASAPCTFQWIEIFGFVSIPLMALASFALIIVLLAIGDRRQAELEEQHG